MKALDINKTYFVTGGAGFIGFFLSKSLLDKGARVIGLDNMNDYYEVSLKEARLDILSKYDNYTFIKGDLADKEAIFKVFDKVYRLDYDTGYMEVLHSADDSMKVGEKRYFPDFFERYKEVIPDERRTEYDQMIRDM